ncbi:hypothetical protein [Amycolatopsis sp. NPDC021455]|uniref:hypothetical protein n=1 Tax=Amycolatopsis sp. NPDC021455 TaxID=3154901 RepID=UPI0033D6AAD0
MTDPIHRQATLAAALRLNESMEHLGDEMRALRTYGKRNRHYIWALAVSLLLDFILTVVVIIVAGQANNANSLANANRNYQIDSCNSGNATRQTSRDLWNYVLSLAEKQPQNETPDRKKQIADFRAYMEKAYAPRDCSQIGK